jgi:hypothetical protein
MSDAKLGARRMRHFRLIFKISELVEGLQQGNFPDDNNLKVSEAVFSRADSSVG